MLISLAIKLIRAGSVDEGGKKRKPPPSEKMYTLSVHKYTSL